MLTVNDLMTLEPYTVGPETSLRQVLELMKTEGCRQIPVVEDGMLTAIITDRDVRDAAGLIASLEEAIGDATLLDNLSVRERMTRQPLVVTPDTPAYKAATMLSIYKFGALPVVDEGALVGIITVTDFLEYFATARPLETVDNNRPE